MTMLNWYIFDDIETENFETIIEIEKWIEIFDEKLCLLHMTELKFNEIFHILSSSKFIFNIFFVVKKKFVVVK